MKTVMFLAAMYAGLMVIATVGADKTCVTREHAAGGSWHSSVLICFAGKLLVDE